MKLKQSNAFAAFTVLVLIVILFISFYAMLKPFAMTYNKFTDNSKVSGYLTEAGCSGADAYWVNGACQELPERASDLIIKVRYFWLTAPIILAIGLIIWLIIVATRKDPQYYQLPP